MSSICIDEGTFMHLYSSQVGPFKRMESQTAATLEVRGLPKAEAGRGDGSREG